MKAGIYCSICMSGYILYLLQGLVESHDAIANKAYDATPPLATPDSYDSNGITAGGEPIRMVGLNKSPNESLVS